MSVWLWGATTRVDTGARRVHNNALIWLKHPGAEIPGDICTKHVPSEFLRTHLPTIGTGHESGRAECAPEITEKRGTMLRVLSRSAYDPAGSGRADGFPFGVECWRSSRSAYDPVGSGRADGFSFGIESWRSFLPCEA